MNTDTSVLPDVASHSQASHRAHTLEWVGMSEIPMPFRWLDSLLGEVRTEGHAQSCVNMAHPQAKGIHMSRLYLALTQDATQHTFTPQTLLAHLKTMQQSHAELSQCARLALRGQLYTAQQALTSEHLGWKAYPFEIIGTLTPEQSSIEIRCTVTYASTCPCSASLARQLVVQALLHDFKDQDNLSKEAVSEWLLSEKGSYATPHSQRSYATVRVKIPTHLDAFPIKTMIDRLELALHTPVQAAVKRSDEQAFARRNGEQLMFCEDAARHIKAALDKDANHLDYHVQVTHQESLHDHDAVAVAVKGIQGGYHGFVQNI